MGIDVYHYNNESNTEKNEESKSNAEKSKGIESNTMQNEVSGLRMKENGYKYNSSPLNDFQS